MQTQPNQWLANAARRGGLTPDENRPVASDATIFAAWEQVALGCGVDSSVLAEAVARAFRIDQADLAARDQSASRLLTEELARRFLVIPVGQTDRALFVATANPTDFDAESEIRFISGRDTQFRVAPPGEIRDAIQATWSSDHREQLLLTNQALEEATGAVEVIGVMEQGAGVGGLPPDRGPAVKLVNLILFEAARAGASAVLLEPQRNGGRVRIKTGETVSTLLTLPRAAMSKTVERIRELAGYGSSAATLGTRGAIDARISGVPFRLRVARTTEDGAERILIHMTEPSAAPSTSAPDPISDTAGDARPLVLVVDDDESARLLMRTVLEGSGFRVTEAADGPPALEKLAAQDDVAVMILDLQMPKMHGLEVLRQVRATLRTVGLPVVVMTASDRPEDEIALFEAGADDYLHKPVDPPKMIVRIRAVLRRSGVHVEH